MDASIQRSLNDKLYDKRKVGALEYASSRSPLLPRPWSFNDGSLQHHRPSLHALTLLTCPALSDRFESP
jgi:hypothetical protein